MNTKILGAAAIVVLLLLVGGYLVLGKNQEQKTSQNPTPTSSEEKSTSGSILDILNSKDNQECSFSYNTDDSTTQGTSYVAGGKVRTDFTINKDDKKSEYHIIRNGDLNYIWGTDLETGIKITLKEEDLKNNTQVNQYLDYNQKVDYKCSPWLVDNTKFTQPSNIKFVDLSNLTLPKSGVGASCSACNYLSGDDKTMCLKQLNCPVSQ